MSRPQGTPGTIKSPFHAHEHDAILDRDGMVWARRECNRGTYCRCSWGRDWEPWEAVGAAWWDYPFIPDDVPEWVPLCPHERICDAQTDCVRLLREEPRE